MCLGLRICALRFSRDHLSNIERLSQEAARDKFVSYGIGDQTPLVSRRAAAPVELRLIALERMDVITVEGAAGAVVLSCTPAVFRFIPLRQPVCEGQDALFLPKQSFVTIVNTITSSVVPLTPLALVSIFLSCFLEQQTTRIRALSPDIARDLPLLLP